MYTSSLYSDARDIVVAALQLNEDYTMDTGTPYQGTIVYINTNTGVLALPTSEASMS